MIRTTALTMFMAFLMVATGCGDFGYILPPTYQDTGANTDQYELEFELVPDAQMVSEDISPIWDLGRNAFKRGTDRLLVISRTTSYSDKDEDYKVIPGTLRERRRERAWIQIPGDIQVGKAIKLEELEKEFLTGFDVNNLNGNGPLNSTALMKGYIVFESITETEAKINMHIEIRPNRPFLGKDWNVKGVQTVKVYPNGHYATYTVSRDSVLVVGDREGGVVPKEVQGDASSNADNNTNTTQVADANSATNNTTDNANATDNNAANTDNNTDNNDNNAAATDKKFSANDIIGRWAARTPALDYRFQLEKNGTFIYATTRGDGIKDDYAPGMVYGYYTVKQSRTATWIVFDIKEFRFDKKDHMEFLKENPLLAKMEYDGTKLTLTGKFRGSNSQRIVLDAGSYEDMNRVLPPKGRKNVPGETNPMPFKPKLQASDSK